MKLSLVIPAYNEEKVIRNTLMDYINYFKSKRVNYEFVIMVEGTDRTLEIVKSLAKIYKNIRYKYSRKRLGKGGAIIEGFNMAKGNIIGFVDADLAIKPEAFNELLKHSKEFDVVIASRNVPGAVIIKDRPFLQRFGSWGFNTLVKVILGLNINDTQCGAKLFKRAVVKEILNAELTNDAWAFDAELLCLAASRGFKIKEVPTIWEHRMESTFNFSKNFYKVVPQMFFTLLRVRSKYR